MSLYINKENNMIVKVIDELSNDKRVVFAEINSSGSVDIDRDCFEQDYIHHKLPTISNAQQAVKWLESGEKVRRKSWSIGQYIRLSHSPVGMYFIDDNNINTTLTVSSLFNTTNNPWELYVDPPKFKEGNFEEVRNVFDVNLVNITLVLGEKEYTLQLNDDEVFCLVPMDNDDVWHITVNRNHMERQDWRIHDIKTKRCTSWLDE